MDRILITSGSKAPLDEYVVVAENRAYFEIIHSDGRTFRVDGVLKTPVAEDLKPLVTKDPPYVKPPSKQKFSYNGLWFCRSSKRFVTVKDGLATIYDENGKDLGHDKADIDDRGFVNISTGFLDYCWSGNETHVKGTNIPWPRGENFDAFKPNKQV